MDFHMLKHTFKLRAFGLIKIPLLAYLRPSVVELDQRHCVVRIKLNRRSQNHLGSMYFGALSIGAEAAGGLIAMEQLTARKAKGSFVFKDFRARFLKRAEGDVLFTCNDGERLVALIAQAQTTDQRLEESVHVIATVPDKLGAEPVAEFDLTISVKRFSSGKK